MEYRHDGPFQALAELASGRGGDLFAVDWTGRGLTYRQLLQDSLRLADALSLSRGDPVALVANNSLEALTALAAVWAAGGVAVLIDPLTASEDLEMQLADAKPVAVIADADIAERERKALEGHRVVVVGGPAEGALELRRLLEAGRPAERQGGGRGDVGLAFYYAGIAGRTMQVRHSNFGIYAGPYAFGRAAALGPRDAVLLAASLTHVLGLSTALAALYHGSRLAVMRRFQADEAVKMIRERGVTVFPGVPLMFSQLLSTAEPPALSSLRLALSAAAPLPAEVQLGFRQRFGVPLVQFYGLTEAMVLTMQPPELADVTGTVGRPLPDVEARLVEPGNPAREVGKGDVGELAVRAPWVMVGYAEPEETARAIRDGWLLTGDLMAVDERGLLYFRGVRKRMLKYKGYPIFPRDLEVILLRHPAVKEARVTGEPDPEAGQLPVAYVVVREGASATPEDLMSFVNSRVAFYKKLRKIYIVDTIPNL